MDELNTEVVGLIKFVENMPIKNEDWQDSHTPLQQFVEAMVIR